MLRDVTPRTDANQAGCAGLDGRIAHALALVATVTSSLVRLVSSLAYVLDHLVMLSSLVLALPSYLHNSVHATPDLMHLHLYHQSVDTTGLLDRADDEHAAGTGLAAPHARRTRSVPARNTIHAFTSQHMLRLRQCLRLRPRADYLAEFNVTNLHESFISSFQTIHISSRSSNRGPATAATRESCTSISAAAVHIARVALSVRNSPAPAHHHHQHPHHPHRHQQHQHQHHRHQQQHSSQPANDSQQPT